MYGVNNVEMSKGAVATLGEACPGKGGLAVTRV
jgi:hypothetical protein